jgi:hypothetical protein
MQEISKLPVYTGTIPNKAAQSDNEFANNIFGFINYSGNVFVGNFNTIIGQFNVFTEEINTAAVEVSDNKNFVSNAKTYVAQTIALLPNGTINNTTAGDDKTYSSKHIDDLLLGNATQKFQVEDGTEENDAVNKKQLDTKVNKTDVYNKTELDLKISYQQFDKPSKGPLFVKVSPSSIKIPTGLKLTVGTTSFKVVSNYILTLADNLIGSDKAAGTDYFVYAKSDATFYISADDTITTDRLIGGFHYGLVGESEAPSGEKTEEMMVRQRGIWAASCWDLKHRPAAKSPRAQNFAFGIWADIYPADEDIAIRGYSSPWKDPYATTRVKAKLAGGTTEYGRGIPKIPLAFGGNATLTYGKLNHWDACEIAASLGKRLLSFTEFSLLAKGVLENVSSLNNNYETTMGAIEHYPNLTSEYLEQATGVQWMWSSTLATNPTGATWTWRAVTEGRGQIYSVESSPNAVRLGGDRDNGVNAGSRASYWDNYVWVSSWSLGCRFACDHLELE